jgi:hypothetical protein
MRLATKAPVDRRLAALRSSTFPPSVVARATAALPDVSADDRALVSRGLKQWFEVCLRADGVRTGMPSRVVDDAWHEFICHTRAYEEFCRTVMGRFLHHDPEATMGAADVLENRTVGMARTWVLGCLAEGLDPGADRQPLLFTVDASLGLPATNYVTACRGAESSCWVRGDEVCVRHRLLVHVTHAVPAQRGWRRGGQRTVSGSDGTAYWAGAWIGGSAVAGGFAGAAGTSAGTSAGDASGYGGGDFGAGGFGGGDFGGGAGCGGGGCGGG